ncbi:MAG: CoA-binding protein [Bacteroidota bacterium]
MDTKFKNRVNDFLAQKNIAFAGYSSEGTEVANHLYNKFKKNGYNVFAVNPKFKQVKNIECFPDIKSIPEKPDALMISTPPSATINLVKECIELGIKHVWIHKAFGNGSYSKDAVKLAEKNGIEIIPNACPMMFLKPDIFHACVKWVLNIKGKLKIEDYQAN